MVNNIAKRIVPLCFLLLLLIGVGCSGDEFKYTTKHANFVFDTRLHGHSAALATALGNVGVFCSVSETLSGGQRSFRFDNHQGLVDVVSFNAIDARQTQILGQNNLLIVGYGNLDTPAPFFAYDGECPHCFDYNAIPLKSYPLSVNSAGIAQCKNCKRAFNLNTGGNMIQGEGRYRLVVYRASNTPREVVIVKN